MSAFNGVKVFCATVTARRQTLGEEVERWLEAARQQPNFQIIDIVVRQSSDAAFHCLSILVFFKILPDPLPSVGKVPSSKTAAPTTVKVDGTSRDSVHVPKKSR